MLSTITLTQFSAVSFVLLSQDLRRRGRVQQMYENKV